MLSFLKRLFAGAPSITIDELDALLTQRAINLIDVREPGEFKSGHVPGAVNIPMGQLDARITKLKKDKPYAVICASGSRSSSATYFLLEHGFEGTVSVRGGTGAWQRSGRKTVR
jgi:rhodanese-related sulfurtransferase